MTTNLEIYETDGARVHANKRSSPSLPLLAFDVLIDFFSQLRFVLQIFVRLRKKYEAINQIFEMRHAMTIPSYLRMTFALLFRGARREAKVSGKNVFDSTLLPPFAVVSRSASPD